MTSNPPEWTHCPARCNEKGMALPAANYAHPLLESGAICDVARAAFRGANG